MAASPAQAGLIDLGYIFVASPMGSPANEAAYIEGLTGASVTYLNKFNYGSTGGFDNTGAVGAGSFGAGGSDKSVSKTISWDLSGTGYAAAYVLIKNGNVSPHLYRLYQVEPDQGTIGSGTVTFAPDYSRKQISHVSWFGVPSTPPTSVPDGGMTLTLLGTALVALGVLRRKVGP
jgi:hypothetical protein